MVDIQRIGKISSTSSDRVRFLLLGVLLLVVIAAYLFTRGAGLRTATRQAEEGDLLPAEAENAPPAASIDPERLRGVRDETASERLELEHEAYLHLLMEAGKTVPGDFRRMGLRSLDLTLEEAVRADPAAHRGQVFSVKAMLTALFERPVSFDLDQPDSASPRMPCWMGVAQDWHGRRYSFSTLTRPRNASVGQVLRIEGIFFKRLDLWVSGAGEDGTELLVEDTLHLVGKDLVPSFYRMSPVHQLDLQLLDTVRDFDVQDRMLIDENVLFHCLSFLQNVDADRLADEAQDVTSAALKNDAETYRGRPIRVLGTFVDTWKRELGPAGENPLDLTSVNHGLLVHGGPSFTYLISAEPKPTWLTRDTNVIVEGIFLQRYVYQARGGEVQESPLVLVKRYVPFEVDIGAVQRFPLLVMLGIAVLFSIWLGISIRGDRRSSEAFRKRYFRNKRRQVLERLGQPPRTEEEASSRGV